jgi:hypothetical protein
LLLVFDRGLLVCGCSIKFCTVSEDLGQDRSALIPIDLRVCKKKSAAPADPIVGSFPAYSIAAELKKRALAPRAWGQTGSILERLVSRGLLARLGSRTSSPHAIPSGSGIQLPCLAILSGPAHRRDHSPANTSPTIAFDPLAPGRRTSGVGRVCLSPFVSLFSLRSSDYLLGLPRCQI